MNIDKWANDKHATDRQILNSILDGKNEGKTLPLPKEKSLLAIMYVLNTAMKGIDQKSLLLKKKLLNEKPKLLTLNVMFEKNVVIQLQNKLMCYSMVSGN